MWNQSRQLINWRGRISDQTKSISRKESKHALNNYYLNNLSSKNSNSIFLVPDLTRNYRIRSSKSKEISILQQEKILQLDINNLRLRDNFNISKLNNRVYHLSIWDKDKSSWLRDQGKLNSNVR